MAGPTSIDINRTTSISLPPAVSGDILQKTQESSAVMRLARRIALPGLGVTVPIITGDPEAGWVGRRPKRSQSSAALWPPSRWPLTRWQSSCLSPISSDVTRKLFTTPWCSGCRACWPRSSTPLFSARLTCLGSNFDSLAKCTAQSILTDAYGGLVAADADIADHDGILNGWVLSPKAKSMLLTAVDGNKRPLFINNVADGAVPMILGAPVRAEQGSVHRRDRHCRCSRGLCRRLDAGCVRYCGGRTDRYFRPGNTDRRR